MCVAWNPVTSNGSSIRYTAIVTSSIPDGIRLSMSRMQRKAASATVMCRFKLKLHLFDLLRICYTTCCTTNPQQIHNRSNKWSLSFMQSLTFYMMMWMITCNCCSAKNCVNDDLHAFLWKHRIFSGTCPAETPPPTNQYEILHDRLFRQDYPICQKWLESVGWGRLHR